MKTIAKRLAYKNDWESDYYFVDGKQIENLYSVIIAGKDYTVTSRIVSVSYNDMGRVYTAKSKHYFVREIVFGVEKEFDLNTLVNKVKVFALGYAH